MHEIITLQFGQQANYIGTHYWNTQESYFAQGDQEDPPVNHDVSFRVGQSPNGHETYTPRALIYDLKGAFGTLRRENALYQLDEQTSPEHALGWSGGTVPLQLPRIEPSAYQTALDQGLSLPTLTTDTVRFWSDFNHVFHHPRSIVQLNEYEVNNTLTPFERHSTGVDLFSQLDREHDLLDRDLRPFLEECDQLQGIQILTQLDDAWGGFTAKYLEAIADELGKGCRWVFGSTQESSDRPREKRFLRDLNYAQALSSFHSSASLQIPLANTPDVSPPYLKVKGESAWQTSAVQAAFFESVTAPSRSHTSQSARATFDELEMALNHEGHRKIAVGSMSVRPPTTDETRSMQDSSRIDARAPTRGMNGVRNSSTNGPTNGLTNGLTNGHASSDDENCDNLDILVFPSPSTSPSSTSSVSSSRPPHVFSRAEVLRGRWVSDAEITRSNAYTRDLFYSSSSSYSSRRGPPTTTFQTPLLFPPLSSFPRIFNFGRGHDDDEKGFAVKTHLSTSTLVAQRLRGLDGVVRRAMNVEDREALSDGLLNVAGEYEEGWSDDDQGTDDE